MQPASKQTTPPQEGKDIKIVVVLSLLIVIIAAFLVCYYYQEMITVENTGASVTYSIAEYQPVL